VAAALATENTIIVPSVAPRTPAPSQAQTPAPSQAERTPAASVQRPQQTPQESSAGGEPASKQRRRQIDWDGKLGFAGDDKSRAVAEEQAGLPVREVARLAAPLRGGRRAKAKAAVKPKT